MKYKYSRNDIHKSETFDLALYGSRDVIRAYKKEVATQSEDEIISSIYGFIEARKISSFYQCVNKIRELHPEWYKIFQSRFLMFKAYLDSKSKENKHLNEQQLQEEYDLLSAQYFELQSKVYEFLHNDYSEIELDKLNEFFSKL